MAPSIVHLPNGQNLTVTPVFGGLFFKANELNLHNSILPAGWTIILNSESHLDDPEDDQNGDHDADEGSVAGKRHHIHRYKQPTLRSDNLFISSISNPSSNDFKPAVSPTRQIAMMLWTTLYWYFHQPQPSLHLTTEASKSTPTEGKPKVDWRINIKREGIFRGRNLLPKLERMGLIATEESSVGLEAGDKSGSGWDHMFVSRRSFWQLSPKLFLFTLTPTSGSSFPGSPYGSRPSSPIRNSDHRSQSPPGGDRSSRMLTSPGPSPAQGLWTPQTPGPFGSGSHLPTYYPPPPPQYIFTNGVRHPIRPKPPRQGETLYIRHIPSVGQYLSFRVASLCDKPVAYTGPVASHSIGNLAIPLHVMPSATSDKSPTPAKSSSQPNSRPTSRSASPVETESDTTNMTDLQLLHKWMNIPRVSKFWGCSGPHGVQGNFLKANLASRHSFPVIGCWDGKPFGYFEIYYVTEDILGKHLSLGDVEHWDRGVHALIGEEEFRGAHRVRCWLTALAHWAFSGDYRTNNFVLEPRVDNERYVLLRSRCFLAPRLFPF
jgi:N5-hydroxyornithine acetyltransferase